MSRGRAHPPRTAARRHGDLPLPARAGADRGLRRVRRAGRHQPALVPGDGGSPDRQLRAACGGSCGWRCAPTSGARGHLTARLELVRAGRAGRCGHRRRGAVRDARPRRACPPRPRPRASPRPRWSSSPPCWRCLLLALPAVLTGVAGGPQPDQGGARRRDRVRADGGGRRGVRDLGPAAGGDRTCGAGRAQPGPPPPRAGGRGSPSGCSTSATRWWRCSAANGGRRYCSRPVAGYSTTSR